MDIQTARGVAARIWGDPEYSHVAMNAHLAEQIAILLMYEANGQEEHPSRYASPSNASHSTKDGLVYLAVEILFP
jgi:hypothetical protein